MVMVSASRPADYVTRLESPYPPRLPDGRFAPRTSPAGISTVLITPAWRLGYRVGPGGRIFADKSAAVRFATVRLAKLAGASAS